MNVFAKRQQEWASLKYLVLSKSQQDYRGIRTLFSDNGWDERKEQQFRAYLQHAWSQPITKGNALNAYQHVWGYFKRKATEEEKRKYEELSNDFTLEQDEILPFLKELTLKYQEQYLLNARLLFPKEEE
ncbi:hypothetical protein UAY_00345 [Enterococcus moraviensis ATCC BAA-383]|uniref:DUF1722 domain-containing protein n=1 Tax=Enterococcus moraviensis ATCC BAA-383 TaxID=1158609 RepID=R2TIP2_9ENTE|nr:YbgA family protein [Enterococcus moraviensis]EOI07003.1 hypothetical protein UAY_00345 [Enterococcus moraviensis ATCC BAA-383]EOT65345.1 hypothetical protein I586_03079 [Enterococcus moraviensis ATCC BAA-383]OJG66768.1 hypothetical protein RV09_GL003237 [Enterococcus moraviensis]